MQSHLQQTGQGRPVVAAFDFDGTMTTTDTLRLFLRDAFGGRRLAVECARLAPEFARFAVGRGNRDRLKARLLHALFAGQPVAPLLARGNRFVEHARALVRPAAVARLRQHQRDGHRCVMVSASLDLYLMPLAAQMGFHDLLCTRLERSGATFTGHLLDGNCRAQNKVRQLTGLLGDLSRYELYAYGDSAGDRELLAAADRPHYRVFARRLPALAAGS